jgi:hypothetical protein
MASRLRLPRTLDPGCPGNGSKLGRVLASGERTYECQPGSELGGRRTCGLKAEDSAQATVHVMHEGRGQLAHGGIEVRLVESDQGRDVDHGVPG